MPSRSDTDVGFIRFEVRNGVRRISCTVSHEALEAASALSARSGPALCRRSFDRFRTVIQSAATLRIAALPPDFDGPIALTSVDLRRVPPQHGAPLFGVAARLPPRSPH